MPRLGTSRASRPTGQKPQRGVKTDDTGDEMTEQTGRAATAPHKGPRFAIGDDVSARIEGRVTAITEYGNGYYSYRITGKEPTGDRYNKFIDEQFLVPALMPVTEPVSTVAREYEAAIRRAEAGALPDFVTRAGNDNQPALSSVAA